MLKTPRFPEYEARRDGNVFEWTLRMAEEVRRREVPPEPVPKPRLKRI